MSDSTELLEKILNQVTTTNERLMRLETQLTGFQTLCSERRSGLNRRLADLEKKVPLLWDMKTRLAFLGGLAILVIGAWRLVQALLTWLTKER